MNTQRFMHGRVIVVGVKRVKSDLEKTCAKQKTLLSCLTQTTVERTVNSSC